MKALVVSVVLCAFICFVQSGPARRRDAHVDVDQGNEDDTWPHPDTINNFPVPDAFVNAVAEVTEDNEEVTILSSDGASDIFGSVLVVDELGLVSVWSVVEVEVGVVLQHERSQPLQIMQSSWKNTRETTVFHCLVEELCSGNGARRGLECDYSIQI
ncbi:unnamed protein product [Pieris brassicae]|uniref:Uncharacterized protein n=1 Tax=Pieris brassicae TaxID=7116 RepID=A0A9P0TES0_PIEBR|nr:unnamed protein product [Pieris brassicae]